MSVSRTISSGFHLHRHPYLCFYFLWILSEFLKKGESSRGRKMLKSSPYHAIKNIGTVNYAIQPCMLVCTKILIHGKHYNVVSREAVYWINSLSHNFIDRTPPRFFTWQWQGGKGETWRRTLPIIIFDGAEQNEEWKNKWWDLFALSAKTRKRCGICGWWRNVQNVRGKNGGWNFNLTQQSQHLCAQSENRNQREGCRTKNIDSTSVANVPIVPVIKQISTLSLQTIRNISTPPWSVARNFWAVFDGNFFTSN